MTQDISKSGSLQYSMQSPRDFHFATSVSEDAHIEGSTSRTTMNFVSDSSQVINPSSSGLVDDPNISIHTLASSSTTSTHVISPSTLQPSTPTATQDISRVPSASSSAETDQEGNITTAPLRIMKRSPSNPDSPFHKTTFQFTSISPSSTPYIQPSIVDIPDFVRSNTTTDADSCPPMLLTNDDGRPPSLDPSGDAFTASSIRKGNRDIADEAPQSSATSSALDASATADSTFDDLTSSHPERFSRLSMGPTLTVSDLLGMTAPKPRNPAPKEGEGEHVQKPVFVTPSHTTGRASLSIAARGKVDEATLASTQAQVGIGLSLLQDLVGDMDSDSESGSDYEESDDERVSHTKETSSTGDAEEGGDTGGATRSIRESLLTEESTVEGLTSRADDVGHQQIEAVTRNETNETADSATKSSFMVGTDSHRRTLTSPTIPKVPSHSPPGHTHRQPSDPNNIFDLSTRERRPSLAPSVVSGKSGTSGSWDGDIYDNYRYSSFSMRSGAGRPSSDSVNGRMKSESITEENNSPDAMGSAVNSKVSLKKSNRTTKLTDTGGVQRRSISVDFDDSIYSQDSGLSNLSREFAAIPLPGHDSLTENRPPPLSITDGPPLLHTNWASPSTSDVQTALPPFTAGVYTPHVGRFDAGNAKMGISLPAGSEGDDGGVGEHTNGPAGMASAMRYRLETERQSPLPEETHDDDERNNTSTSLGLGNGIVIQDDEELPSRILTDEDGHGDSDDVDFFSESYEGNPEGTIVALPPEPSNTVKDQQEEEGQSRIGTDSQSVVGTRSPSTSSNGDSEPPELQSNAVLPYHSQVSNVPPSPERTQPLPTPPSQQGPAIDTHQLRQHSTQPVGPAGRRSLFLPHPNAPKAPAGAPLNIEPGAGIGAVSMAYRRSFVGQGPSVSDTEFLHQGNNLPPQRPPVQAVIHMALSMGPRMMPPTAGRPPTCVLPTIYGRTEVDLSTSVGPVPIAFSIDPPLNSTGTKATAPKGAVLPPIGAGPAASQDTRTKPSPPSSSHASPPRQPATSATQSPSVRNFSSFSSPIKSAIRPATSPGTVTLSSTANKFEKQDNVEDHKPSSSTKASPIPRPNFTAKAPGLRPRSRSFSGFNSGSAHDGQSSNPILEERYD